MKVVQKQLHGFCDTSEQAYAGVVYLRAVDENNNAHIALVMAKTKVAPIMQLTIPWLELCGATILAKLLYHIARILTIPIKNVFAWTDSTVTLSWLHSNPKRFKAFVGNWVVQIIEMVPPSCWRHVSGLENPADSASREIFPGELARNHPWWHGPSWLQEPETNWPSNLKILDKPELSEEWDPITEITTLGVETSLPLLDRVASYTHLVWVTAWIFRFINNCKKESIKGLLSTKEWKDSEYYWWRTVQQETFMDESIAMEEKRTMKKSCKLLPFHPFLDPQGLLLVGGRINQAELPYSKRHPVILPGNHRLVKLMITSEHERLLHAGPTLVSASLSRNLCVLNWRRAICSIVRSCVTCRRVAARPNNQEFG